MKKLALYLAGLLAAIAFAPQASAVPAFARQAGMACSACHFQSFPILTAFGKNFKMGGYTLMGDQGKVEGSQGLSIPNTLNMAVILKARYQKTNGNESAVPGSYTSNSGRWDVPDEFALFAAGRVSENIGALIEITIAGTAHTGVANFKVPFVYDVGNAKVGVVPFSGDAGAAYGFDLFATGSNTTGRVIENGEGYAAADYLGTHTEVTGAAIYVANENFHVNVTPWHQGSQVSATGLTEATSLGGTYLRAAWTPSMAGWDLGVGVQNFSGNSFKGMNGVDAGLHRDSATIVDFQGQGAVAEMPLGIYGSYGFANGSTAAENAACIASATGPLDAFTGCNSFNDGTERRSAFGLLADLGVIPERLGVQFGIIRAKTGMLSTAGSNETDNGITFGMRFKLRQNVNMGAAYTKFSGTAYEAGNSKDATVAGSSGDSILNLTLVMGF